MLENTTHANPLMWTMDGMEAVRSEVPCVDMQMINRYLNDLFVCMGWYMDATPQWWMVCGFTGARYTKSLGSNSYQFYDTILVSGVKIFHFFGDTDGAVQPDAGEKWSELLATQRGYVRHDDYKRWTYTLPGASPVTQHAGSFTRYTHPGGAEFMYLTVKGGWHTVPESNPREALKMFEHFIREIPMD